MSISISILMLSEGLPIGEALVLHADDITPTTVRTDKAIVTIGGEMLLQGMPKTEARFKTLLFASNVYANQGIGDRARNVILHKTVR